MRFISPGTRMLRCRELEWQLLCEWDLLVCSSCFLKHSFDIFLSVISWVLWEGKTGNNLSPWEEEQGENLYCDLIILIVTCSKSCKTSEVIKETTRILQAEQDSEEMRKNMLLYITQPEIQQVFETCRPMPTEKGRALSGLGIMNFGPLCLL